MNRANFLLAALVAIPLGNAAHAEQVLVKHPQQPLRRSMVTRSDAGTIIAKDEFLQTVQGEEVTMHLTYRFLDGSIDDEVTTYTQQGKFSLVRDHHIQKGPFFTRPVDFAVEVPSHTATSRSADQNGKIQIENKRIELPDDLANGIVGTLLLNLSQRAAPLQLGLLVPLTGGRLIRIVVSPNGEQSFRMAGSSLRARVYRIHPELGGIVGFLANLIGVQPKDVIVWVQEGDDPAVVKIVGQLGGYGPIVTSELEGTSFTN